MNPLFIVIIGWLGAFLLVFAYFLLVHRDLRSKSKTYQFMNLFGSLLLGVNAYYNNALPSFASNVFWILIALYGLRKIFK
jgi:lysylphosphatidylglycerol synthetase-like protein (DUF2156 family)